jgi:basic membrane lipoprotein Med (substrate-binding protein (PBP1-ABC) superfamily)
VGGTFAGGNFLGTLENGRVSMDVGSFYLDKVPADLMAEIEALKAAIIADPTIASFAR